MADLSFSIAAAGYPGHQVLDSVSATLPTGQFVALLGANGEGKTTLLRCLAGLHRTERGSVRFNGVPIDQGNPQERAARLAFCPQSSPPSFPFRVDEVLSLARYGRRESPAEIKKQVLACARKHRLHALLGRPIDTLSGGEWRRVCLARTFLQDSACVLLDEPTAHLDLGHRLECFEACRKQASRGKCVLVATHDLETILEFADRFLVLHGGRLIADGPAREVVTEELLERIFHISGVGVVLDRHCSKPRIELKKREEP